MDNNKNKTLNKENLNEYNEEFDMKELIDSIAISMVDPEHYKEKKCTKKVIGYVRKEYDKYTVLLQRIITNLLERRDNLGYRIDYLNGVIPFYEWRNIDLKYNKFETNIDRKVLKKDILDLFEMTNRVFDSDELSIMFKIDMDLIEDIIQEIVNESNKAV
jgi:hypothetical protein